MMSGKLTNKAYILIITALSAVFFLFGNGCDSSKTKSPASPPPSPISVSPSPAPPIASTGTSRYDAFLKDLQSDNPQKRWTAAVNLGILGDKRAVPFLVKSLKDGSENVSILSSWALGTLRDPQAVEPLMDLIKGNLKEEGAIPTFAIWALGEIRDSRATELLTTIFHESTDTGKKEQALKAIAKIGGPGTTELLIETLKHGDEDVRAVAALAFGIAPNESAVPPLIEALSDPEPMVTRNAVYSLGIIGDKKALPALEKMLNSNDEEIVKAAQEAIARIKSDKNASPSIPPQEDRPAEFIASLDIGPIENYNPEDWNLGMAPVELSKRDNINELIKGLKNPDLEARAKAALALGNRGKINDRALQALIEALGDESSDVRWNVAKALGKLKDHRAVEPLLKVIDDPDKDVREDVVEALGRLGDKRAVKPIAACINDPYVSVRLAAAAALGKLKDRAGFEALVKALEDSQGEVRREAALSLGEMGDPEAVEFLKKALKDKDETVRKAAKESLEMLK